MRRHGTRPALAHQPRRVTESSSDGLIAFTLTPCAGGIHVERFQLRAGAGRVVHSMHFADDASFVRWCDADRLQFRYPLLYANMRRSGCALFCPPE